MPKLFTTREVAELLGTLEWRVRRLFEDGSLPEPDKFGGKRAIPGSLIPQIVDLLRERNWLVSRPVSLETQRQEVASA